MGAKSEIIWSAPHKFPKPPYAGHDRENHYSLLVLHHVVDGFDQVRQGLVVLIAEPHDHDDRFVDDPGTHRLLCLLEGSA